MKCEVAGPRHLLVNPTSVLKIRFRLSNYRVRVYHCCPLTAWPCQGELQEEAAQTDLASHHLWLWSHWCWWINGTQIALYSPPPHPSLHGVIPNPLIVGFEDHHKLKFMLTFLVCSVDNVLGSRVGKRKVKPQRNMAFMCVRVLSWLLLRRKTSDFKTISDVKCFWEGDALSGIDLATQSNAAFGSVWKLSDGWRELRGRGAIALLLASFWIVSRPGLGPSRGACLSLTFSLSLSIISFCVRISSPLTCSRSCGISRWRREAVDTLLCHGTGGRGKMALSVVSAISHTTLTLFVLRELS